MLQCFREEHLWRVGYPQFSENYILELPANFGGHDIVVSDDQRSDSLPSENEVPGIVHLSISDGPSFSDEALVRPGRAPHDFGRYHLWLKASIFTGQEPGAPSSFWLAQRIQPGLRGRARVRLIVMSADGAVSIDTLPRYSFNPDYRTFRATQLVRDGAFAPFPFSILDGFIFPVIFLLFPIGTLAWVIYLIRSPADETVAV